MSAQDLLEEFDRKASNQASFIWDLSNHSIQPDLLKELFTLMSQRKEPLHATAAIDLDGNRLSAATADDFAEVFKAMEQPPLHRLLVRFGYEVFIPNFVKAQQTAQEEGRLGERATLASPWASSTMLAGQLKDLIAAQRKQLGVAEKRLAKLEIRKDPTEQLRQMKNYRDTDDRLIEEGVTLAVADFLQQPSVILLSRYEYQGQQGDLDGLVQGIYKEEEVIVFIQAKHNMDSSWRKAKSELINAHQYWQELLSTDIQDPNVDSNLAADYITLCVDENRKKKTMFAFGGAKFTEAFAMSKFKELQQQCLYVVTNTHGDFIAKALN